MKILSSQLIIRQEQSCAEKAPTFSFHAIPRASGGLAADGRCTALPSGHELLHHIQQKARDLLRGPVLPEEPLVNRGDIPGDKVVDAVVHISVVKFPLLLQILLHRLDKGIDHLLPEIQIAGRGEQKAAQLRVFPMVLHVRGQFFQKDARLLKLRCDAYTFGISQSSSYAGTGLAELNKIIPLSYWRTVTHQCSCIWLVPHRLMLPPMTPEQAQMRSEKTARLIAAEVMAGIKTEKKPPENPVNAADRKSVV